MPKKGYKQSEEHKAKVLARRIEKGQLTPWNKGLTADKDERVRNCCAKSQATMTRLNKRGGKKKLDIANKSGKYLRDVDDYEWLCRSCHCKKDKSRLGEGYDKERFSPSKATSVVPPQKRKKVKP